MKTLLLLAALFPLLASAQSKLSGQVFDKEKNVPMPSVEVRVLRNVTRTDSSGRYQVNGIYEGKHDVHFISRSPYKDTIVTGVTFTAGNTTYLNIDFPTKCQFEGNSKTCPVCKKEDEAIPIIYGKPTMKRMRKLEGKAMFRGCITTGCDPKWYCKRDKKEY